MKKSTIIIQLSVLFVAVTFFSGCGNNIELKPQAYDYQTYPKQPNYAIIKPTKEKEFSEENLANMIKELEGRPYVWAEEGPYCFDCSGYIYYIFGKMGVDIPRVAREQFKIGKPVAFEDLKFGDLVFFDTTKNKSGKITHVGIYLKDGWFTQASSRNKKIVYTNFNTDTYYRSRFVGARRYYEKDGDRYAILQPKMQNELAQTLAANNKNEDKLNIKPTSIIASANSKQNIRFDEPKVTEKPVATIVPNSTATPQNNTNGEIAYEDLQKIGTNDDYTIKEKLVSINNNTDTINNASIQSNVNATTKTRKNIETSYIHTKQIAKNETESSNNRYYVQVGHFQNKPDRSFLDKIKAEGYAYTIMPISENGKLSSKVLIGPFKDDSEAKVKLNSVKKSIIKEAFITKIYS